LRERRQLPSAVAGISKARRKGKSDLRAIHCRQKPGVRAMNTVRVSLAERSYDIAITSNDTAGIGPFAAARTRGRRALLVTDNHLAADRPAVSRSLREAGF